MEFNPFSLKDKVVLITGASSGIGRQCAIDCSKMGAKVALLARNEERLQETLSQMQGGGHLILPIDLTDFEQLPIAVKQIVDTLGQISGVLHCAGISSTLPLKLMDISIMERFVQSNVFSAMLLSKEVCKMKNYAKEGMSVVFFSSIMGCVGDNAKSLYSLSKGALIAATRSLACEYAKKNIRFNCVSPGVILTPINANQPYMQDPDRRKAIEEKHLLGFGETTDISNACIYLLSDAARWITGQNIIVDGGYTVR